MLELLAAYSPEYPCLLQGLVALQPRVEQVFSGGRMHITLEVTRDNGGYVRGRDEPVYGAHNGPNCRGLPNPAVPAPQVPVNDGYDYGARPPPAPLPAALAPVSMGYAGTAEERACSSRSWPRPPAYPGRRCPTWPSCCGGRCCAERW